MCSTIPVRRETIENQEIAYQALVHIKQFDRTFNNGDLLSKNQCRRQHNRERPLRGSCFGRAKYSAISAAALRRLSFSFHSIMADPLSVATGIISLITLAVKLVAGAAGLIDKTVAAHREASNELQRLQQDLERLGEQMDEIYCKLQFLVASTKDRAFKNLLQE